jgi:DNA-binding transcriptional regulator GbsR (MarR family)
MDREQFVENLGLLIEELTGLTRMSGRILGWLMTSDAATVTMPDLTEALHTSKSAISTSTRQLMQAGLIERRGVPGQRRDVYQLRSDVWARLMLLEADKYSRFHDLAVEAQGLADGATEQGQKALEEMAALNGYLAEEVPQLIRQWQGGGQRTGGKRAVRTRKGSSPHAWEL